MSDQKPTIRNRVKKRTRMLGSELHANPRNWRVHPESQKTALRSVLNHIGQVGELYAYYSERNGGKLTLIDGHLRSSDEFAAMKWDVAITDLDDREADELLFCYDPLAGMAEGSVEKMEELYRDLERDKEGRETDLNIFMENTAADYGILALGEAPASQTDTTYTEDGKPVKFEEGVSTHVVCPACAYDWSLSDAEIARIKPPKQPRKKKPKAARSDADAQQEAQVGG